MKMPRWARKLTHGWGRHNSCPECGGAVRDTYCDVCGYDLVRKARDSAPPRGSI